MAKLRIILAFLFVVGANVYARAADEIQLYQLQKAIMELQARAVNGDDKANDKARQLMNLVNEQFEAGTFENLKSKRNTIAAAVYLIGGGKPAPVRRALTMGKFQASERPLLEAVLAFTEGQANYARDKLATFQPLSVDPVLAGPLAFAKGTLEMQSNYEAALRLYDLVRLLSPKSAFEEAAMRRRAVIYADQQHAGGFFEVASKYMKRFPRSPYAEEFRQEVLRIFKNVMQKGGEVNSDNLFDLVELYPERERINIFIGLAREASISGNIGLSEKIVAHASAKQLEPGLGSKLVDIKRTNSNVKEVIVEQARREDVSGAQTDDDITWRHLAESIQKLQVSRTREAISSNSDRAAVQTWDGASEAIMADTKKVNDLLAASGAELKEMIK